MNIAKSVGYFLSAGLLELSGPYFIWLSTRAGRSAWYAVAGILVLAAYGFMHTLQPASYGRVQAAYSGFFIAMALLWGWQIEGIRPDRFDLIGGAVALAGVGIIMYWPRG